MNFSRVSDHRKHFGVFRPLIGRPLQSLEFAKYHFNSESSGDDIGPLALRFDSNTYLLLSIASDGDSVLASGGRLFAQEMLCLEDGSQCDWRQAGDGGEPVGQRLMSVDAQVDRVGDSDLFTSGWILKFESRFLSYYNIGDDACLLHNQYAPSCKSVITAFEHVAGNNKTDMSPKIKGP